MIIRTKLGILMQVAAADGDRVRNRQISSARPEGGNGNLNTIKKSYIAKNTVKKSLPFVHDRIQ